MSSFPPSPVTPARSLPVSSVSGLASPPTITSASPGSLDMTSAVHRYKLRACLTILHQVDALLTEVRAAPCAGGEEGGGVPEEYVAFPSLGEDDSLAPLDITTPRPLRHDVALPKGGTYAAGEFPLPVDPMADGLDLEEDGRATALRAVNAAALHDPRLATIQGLLQHVDQISLENVDNASSPLATYPAWLAPHISRVFARINAMYPTPLRRARDARAQVDAEAFRARHTAAREQDMDARTFESFLDRQLDEARRRQNRLQQLNALKRHDDPADNRPDTLSDFDADEPDAHSSAVVSPFASPSRRVAASPIGRGEPAEEDDDEDPFAAHGSDAHDHGDTPAAERPTSNGATGSRVDSNAAADDPDDGNQRRRVEQRAAHLRTLYPASRKAFLQSEARTQSGRGVAGLTSTGHRPSHTRPFGYSSHKKKKISDPLEPVERNTRFDARPRKAPGLLEPRKVYAIPTTHEKKNKDKGEDVAATKSQLQKKQSPLKSSAALKTSQKKPSRQRSELPADDTPNQRYETNEQPQSITNDEDDDDPFAVHDTSEPDVSRPAASPARPRSSGAPSGSPVARKSAQRSSTTHGEEKEQPLERHRPAPLRSSEDEEEDEAEDDPFAEHDATSPQSRSAPRKAFNLPTPSTVQRLLASPLSSRPSSRATTPSLSRASSAILRSNSPSRPTSRAPSRQASRKALHPSSLSSPTAAGTRGLSRASTASSDPFEHVSREVDHSDAESTMQDLELRLLAMHEELKENTQMDVKQQVNDALKKLTESLHINPAPVDDRARASRVSSRTHSQTSEFDLSTLAWDNKLHEVLSRGKRIVPSPQAVVPSVTPDEQQATPAPQGDLSIVAHALASTQNELSAERGAHARLESEKRELEVALAQLQERDAHHSKSLYHLMEKLTSLNAAGGASGVTSPAVKRRMLSDAAFIAPFGSPTTPSTVLSPPARHAVAPRGHAAPPSVSHFSSGADDPFSDADPYEESLILQAPPQARVHDDQSQRLAELQSELDRAQHTNASLVAKLEAATFQTAVLHRTSEAHQLLAAQQMVHRSDQARAAEDARAAESKRQHLEDLQKIQRTERQIAEIQKEQKELRAKFAADRAALESEAARLSGEVSEHVALKEQYRREAEVLRARVAQVEADQDAMRRSGASFSSGVGGGSPYATPSKNAVSFASAWGTTVTDHPLLAGVSPTGSQEDASVGVEFFSFLASGFRGDYLKARQNAPLARILAQQAQQACAAGLQADDHEEILFSDYVTKYNRRNSGQPRALVLTSQALYLFLPRKQDLRRRFALRDLTAVALSRLCTDLLVLRHGVEHDCLLTTPKRSELMYHLQIATKQRATNAAPLAYAFSERLYVRDRGGMVRDVNIIDSQSFKLGKPFPAQGHQMEG